MLKFGGLISLVVKYGGVLNNSRIMEDGGRGWHDVGQEKQPAAKTLKKPSKSLKFPGE